MKRFLCAALCLFGVEVASAAIITYSAILSGPNKFPPNTSPGKGVATVVIDDLASTMSLQVTFADLVGATTAAHIHCCTALPLAGNAGVATTTPSFPGFPAGVTSGAYSRIFDLMLPASYNAAFITGNSGVAGAQAALLAAMAAGRAYFNLHSSAFPGGEIRGFITPTQIAEPGGLALFGLAAAALVMVQRRSKKSRHLS